ncbi:MAG: radical SAM family heme chaperone HemW [Planctomycetes bacterium]|nr:radical SAM family heme chaperone HemW [Planctomycetota bacterium]
MSAKGFKENQEESQPPADVRADGLYVHVPLCLAKCRYCDFYSLPLAGDLAGRYVRAAGLELVRLAEFLAWPAGTIFVGGGTPTCLGAGPLGELLGPLGNRAGPETEFSVEANPGTVDGPVADLLAGSGVNRVSLGIQSLQPDELALLGRIHDARQAVEAFGILRRAGLKNLGADLIYGLPGQSMESWLDTLGCVLELSPEHLSCYCLSIEEGTPLADDLRAGRIKPPDEALQKEMYYAAIEQAGKAGLEHYEISNFARPGRRCRHNLIYWHNQPYIGVGPGAASYIAGSRSKYLPDLAGWLDAVLAGRRPAATAERLTGMALMAETLMLNLRLIEGVDRQAFAERFGLDPLAVFPAVFNRYAAQDAVQIDAKNIRIAPKFLFVADSILADLLAKAV